MKFIKKVFQDLFCSSGSSRISQTKWWCNIAYATALFKFVSMESPGPEIFAIVIGVMGTHAAVNKITAMSNAKTPSE